jgi:oligopeptide transport system substrate-binding protein
MKTLYCFISTILLLLISCTQENTSQSNKAGIKIALDQEPNTLDPRLATSVEAANALHMMYEGLMRIDYQGHAAFGLAESVDQSPDLKTYTFNLRKTSWSDGTPLTAKDFEETWLSILNPSFPAPNAYQLYYIKGAQAYKEGTGSREDVGIKASSPRELVVELENPTPYFLKIVSTFFYLPVSPQMRQSQVEESAGIISNGPFKLSNWQHHNEIVFVKNPLYWDAKVVSLDEIVLTILDENTSLNMFEAGQLDRTGSPTATLPQDSIPSLHHLKQLKVKPAAATHWFRFNTEMPPMNNTKMRKAFNLALDRQAIVEHVTQGNQLPATGIVPPSVGWGNFHYYQDHDIPGAWQLFQEALTEMNIDKDSLPPITLIYIPSDRNHKIAQTVQQQWNKAFGIQVKLQSQETKMFCENEKNGNYQISTGSWYADFSDPINFLEIFKRKNNSSNRTNWENPEYIQLLDASSNENDNLKRMEHLQKAEAILIENAPIAPLFFASFNYLENENMGGVGLSVLGILDLKYAFIEDVTEASP